MENNNEEYIKMTEVYNALNDYILPHIENVKTFNTHQINMFFDIGTTLTNKLETEALNVYKKLPKEEKLILRNRYEQNKTVSNNNCMYETTTYIDRVIEYLDYTEMVNKYLLTTHFYFGDGMKMRVIKYDLLPKAYKKLNDILFCHIKGTQTLYEYEIKYITSAIKFIFTTLNAEALDCCKFANGMQKHKMLEDYFNSHISINEDCELSELDIAVLREHNAWKKWRVEHLQWLLRDKRARVPHDEEYFVKRNMMYNENYY